MTALDDFFAHATLATLGMAIRRGDVSALDAASWHVSRIETLDRRGPALNAVRTLDPNWVAEARRADDDLASGRDRGPLHGICVLLKDNIMSAGGMPASAGAAALAAFYPRMDATIVRRLRRAGAIILGKTNMTEFADYVADTMPSGWSGSGGMVRNPHGGPYARGQGSSVGSAAAVAAGFCMVAIGSETQNSIQAPACHTSVFGFKPTVGLVSRSGIVPLVPSQDSPGPLTRCAADAALVLDALAGPDVSDTLGLGIETEPFGCAGPRRRAPAGLAGSRIGVLRKAIADRAEFAGVLPCFEARLDRLSLAGAVIVDPCDLPSAEQVQAVRSTVFRSEFKAALDAFLEQEGSPCGIGSLNDLLAWNAANAHAIPYGQDLLVAAAASSLDAVYRRERRQDIVLSRTAGIDAAMARFDVDVLVAPMAAAAKCSGKAGTPVAAIPAGLDRDGHPFGITLLAQRGEDRALLAMAALVEHAIGERVAPRF